MNFCKWLIVVLVFFSISPIRANLPGTIELINIMTIAEEALARYKALKIEEIQQKSRPIQAAITTLKSVGFNALDLLNKESPVQPNNWRQTIGTSYNGLKVFID